MSSNRIHSAIKTRSKRQKLNGKDDVELKKEIIPQITEQQRNEEMIQRATCQYTRLNTLDIIELKINNIPHYFLDETEAKKFIMTLDKINKLSLEHTPAIKIDNHYYQLEQVKYCSNEDVSILPKGNVYNLFLNMIETYDGGGAGYGQPDYAHIFTVNKYSHVNRSEQKRVYIDNNHKLNELKPINIVKVLASGLAIDNASETSQAALKRA
jgi:hypothetical protein